MLRIVVAALGSDPQDHEAVHELDHEAQMLSRVLRDAGHEVIFTGARQTPEQVVGTAIAEDADLVGISIGSEPHLAQLQRLTGLLTEQGAADIVVFGGGDVPADDLPALARLGVATVFAPDATAAEVTGWVAEHAGDE